MKLSRRHKQWIAAGVGLVTTGALSYVLYRHTGAPGASFDTNPMDRVAEELKRLQIQFPETMEDYGEKLNELLHYNRFDVPEWLKDAFDQYNAPDFQWSAP